MSKLVAVLFSTLIYYQLGLGADDNSPALPPEAADEVNRNIEQMPDRQILDFLIRYFVAEVNWYVLFSTYLLG